MKESDEIKELLRIMEEHGLIELEIEKEGLRIRLKKEGISPEDKIIVAPPQMEKAKPQEERKEEKNLSYIRSPMVGTFYRAPAPDAPPFVDIGDTVENGQTVCIIESMKLMNEIKAEQKAKILEILVENGSPVEYGQPLFKIQIL